MRLQSLLVKELEFVKEEGRPSGEYFTNLTLEVVDLVGGRIASLASMEMVNKTVLPRIVSMTYFV